MTRFGIAMRELIFYRKEAKEGYEMEIVVVSKTAELNKEFIPAIDQILYREKIKCLSLYGQVMKYEQINLLPQHNGYLFFVDVQKESFSTASILLETIMNSFPACNLVLLTDNGIRIHNLVNSIGMLNGIINFQWAWKEQLKDILKTIAAKMRTLCKGVLILHYNMDRMIVYEDIYYIETIKATHCCTVHHKKGTERLRANIKDLIGQLDSRFEIVHASTIANLSLIKRIDRESRCLYFNDEISCNYSNACAKRIRNRMREFV